MYLPLSLFTDPFPPPFKFIFLHNICLGPSIKYVTKFWTYFDPSLPCHTLSHISGSLTKVRHTLRTPRLLVVHAYIHTYVFTRRFVLVCGGVSESFVRDFFTWKVLSGVVYVHPPSVIIHPLQQKAKHHYRCNMYETFSKSVTSHVLEPLPSVTNCHTFSDPSPSSVTYFINGLFLSLFVPVSVIFYFFLRLFLAASSYQ